jgi:hypothetical protein
MSQPPSPLIIHDPSIRLVARGILEGSKRPFFAHAVPFFGHVAQLYSLKKTSHGQKITLFSPLVDPAQQVNSIFPFWKLVFDAHSTAGKAVMYLILIARVFT